MNTISIGIFDDHPVVASGLAAYLSQYADECEIAFTAHSRAGLLAALQVQLPAVLVVDIVAPDIVGLDLFAELQNKYASLKVIAYTSLRGPILIENLLSLGVMGYVHKLQPLDALIACMRQVDAGKRNVPEKYMHLISRYHIPTNRLVTAREMEIVHLIANEATTQRIAEQLGISVKTVENHRLRIYEKLGVKNVAGLILELTRLGYIS